jgi:hypothetical protein
MKASAKKRWRPQRQTKGPLIMRVHLEANGSTYALDMLSEDWVKERFPEARGLPLVFLGWDEEEEFETLHGPLWPLVAMLLTGLTMEQIGPMGGVRLEDSGTNKVIWEWRPDAATAK